MTASPDQSATLSLELPDEIELAAMLDLGRQLVEEHRRAQWRVADWLRLGQARFGSDFQQALPAIVESLKSARALAKIAEAFPAVSRCSALAIEHYIGVHDLPTEEAKSLLSDAVREGWDVRRIRKEARATKLRTGQHVILDEDDWEYRQTIALQRIWNRTPRDVRETFFESVKEANLGTVDL